MNEDFLDMLRALLEECADFMVVGAHALALYDVPRATGDIDIWIGPDPGNAERVYRALERFGAPLESLGVSLSDLARPAIVVQLGLAPRRIDLMTELSGVDFAAAMSGRVVHKIDGLDVPFLGKSELIRNKRATGRLKDLADVERLEGDED